MAIMRVLMRTFAVMAARGFPGERKLARQQLLHRLIRIAGYAAEKLNARLGQSALRATANAPADQRIHAISFQ